MAHQYKSKRLQIIHANCAGIDITSRLLITACAHKNPQPETIMICDDSGCVDRPKDYVSFDAAKALGGDSEGKITALENLTKQDPRAAYDLALRFFWGDGIQQDSYRSIK